MELAPMDHWMVEHRLDGGREGLGAVDHDEDRPGHVQAPFPQVGEQIGTNDGGVLRGALHDPERVLGAVNADPQRHDAAVLDLCG